MPVSALSEARRRGELLLPYTDKNFRLKVRLADSIMELLEQGSQGMVNSQEAIKRVWQVIDDWKD